MEYKKVDKVKFYYFVDKQTSKPIGAVGIDKNNIVYCRSTLYPHGVSKISQLAAEEYICGVWNMTDDKDNYEYFESRWLYEHIKKIEPNSRFLNAIENMEIAVKHAKEKDLNNLQI